MRSLKRPVLILLALLVAWAPDARGQESLVFHDYVRAGLNWYTIETEHFLVHFHLEEDGGSSRTAQVTARIAEEIYGPVTSYWGHEPDTKVSIVLKDYEDYSNGAAYFFDNKIEIWAPSLDSPHRGEHNWLRNVITHELTHIVQIQAAAKGSRRMPFYYLQWLHYEAERRPDVLYGYPNLIATYPIPVVNVPAWLAEGTAQFQLPGLQYDAWDAHRDMLLRTRVLAGEELALRQMGGFYSHNSLERESVYNHGFAFTQYLANRFGDDAPARLSRSLSRWSSWNVERAMRHAFNESAGAIYGSWMEDLRASYTAEASSIASTAVEGRVLIEEGFSNFSPRFSPDGTRVAFVSNRGEDFGRLSLFVYDMERGSLASMELPSRTGDGLVHVCAFGHRIASGVGTGLAWRPDGEAVVITRRRDTRNGSQLSDLYEVDLTTKRLRRMTHDARAHEPAISPDGSGIVYVEQEDGTTNLVLADGEGSEARALTHFADGTQVTEPAWHPSGEWIYFGLSREGNRRLARVRVSDGVLEMLTDTDVDSRSPAFSGDGTHVYFSSGRSGIFNLYRMPAEGGPAEAVTSVLGGAFQPAVAADGRVAFARFDWDGYRIALLDQPVAVDVPAYAPPVSTKKQPSGEAGQSVAALNEFDDSDIRAFSAEDVGTIEGVERYSDTFTSFSFMPVVRLDQYVGVSQGGTVDRMTERTAGRALLRNTKVGLYATSREMLERMSFIGGLMVAPASGATSSVSDFLAPGNLLGLERDLFLQIEYGKGIGRNDARWMPRIAVEVFNVTRNVNNGLEIEEFPCTACFPDTTYADLSYNLWEVDVAARSKISRVLLLEAGFRYSPYRVTTQRFFSREMGQTVDAWSSKYFVGRGLRFGAIFDGRRPHRHMNVFPEGLYATAGYEYEPGSLLDRFDIEDGVLTARYEDFRNHRLHADVRYVLRLPGSPGGGVHGVGLRARGTTILGGPVDSFFNSYVGGLVGARGYPFYALGGNETILLQASYTRPVFDRIDRQIGFLYLDKLYGRVYADAAAAWSGAFPGMGAFRRDAGAELRLALGSFYLLPTALFASATYGFDRFEMPLQEGLLTPDGRSSVSYGGEMMWHFGVLFGFDL
jgi:Tol biopolymer transport system component